MATTKKVIKTKPVTKKPIAKKAKSVKLRKAGDDISKTAGVIPVSHNDEVLVVATSPKSEDHVISSSTTNGGKEKYFEAVGRRKRAVARVRLFTKKSTDQEPPEGRALILIDGKPYFEYFKETEMQNTVDSPLKKLKSIARFKATVLVSGGGMNGQAGAIRHGLSRALVLFDENFSKKFRKAGYLTRDSREKERRKYGLKKARKAPRWAKR